MIEQGSSTGARVAAGLAVVSSLVRVSSRKGKVPRNVAATFLAVAASLVLASSVLAMDCTNASKSDPAAGAQILIGSSGQILWVTPGLAQRFEQGIVDPDNGAGFHGLIAFDLDGDGVADISTWVGVGPEGNEIPKVAQLNGPACRGLTSIGLYFTECLGG
jgi:hypothetical protein